MPQKKTNTPKKKVYENPLRARRIRIYPTPQQEARFALLFGAVRFCYNMLVEKYRIVGKGGVSLKDLRETIAAGPTWLKEIPYEIKDVAVRDFDKARKSHFAKLKKLKENDPAARHDARFKFRSKRDAQQSFEVRPRDLVRQNGQMAFLALDVLNGAEDIPEKAEAVHSRQIRTHLLGTSTPGNEKE